MSGPHGLGFEPLAPRPRREGSPRGCWRGGPVRGGSASHGRGTGRPVTGRASRGCAARLHQRTETRLIRFRDDVDRYLRKIHARNRSADMIR